MAGRLWVAIVATGAIAVTVGAVVGGNLGAAAATATYEPQVVAAEQDASAAQAEADEAQQKTSDVIAESNRVSAENAATLAEQQKQLDETIAVRDDYRANLLLALDERDAAIAEADRGWDAYDEIYDAAQIVLVEATALLEETDTVLAAAQTQLDIAAYKNRALIDAVLLLDGENARLRTSAVGLRSTAVQALALVCQMFDWYNSLREDPGADRSDCDQAGFERDMILSELNVAVAERDAALAVTGPLRAERDTARADRDVAITERDAALVERDEAIAQRDTAIEERDAALADADAALRAENDALRGEVEALRAERDGALTDRDAAVSARNAATAERDALAAEKAALLAELDTCRADLGFAQSAAANMYDALEMLLAGDVDGSDAALERAFAAADSVSGAC
ncbi:hypothetical protein [Microbacterium sp. SS28]|uniref:hypothetical protein n=1 Tax=Microbacterium sp. SS28 TaxID=2919948 RepID=UPI001FA9F199|nr:hypothetical protein [Microbacterium sp. SS28]